MSVEKNIFYSQISLYNLAILLNVIDIIVGSVLLSVEKNTCYSYYANTIYTIVISIVVITALIVIIYFMAKYKEFNKYIFICNLILFGIFAINFIYETIVLSYNCNNIYYKQYLLSNIIYNSLAIIISIICRLYHSKSQIKKNLPTTKLEKPVIEKNYDNNDVYDKSYEIM